MNLRLVWKLRLRLRDNVVKQMVEDEKWVMTIFSPKSLVVGLLEIRRKKKILRLLSFFCKLFAHLLGKNEDCLYGWLSCSVKCLSALFLSLLSHVLANNMLDDIFHLIIFNCEKSLRLLRLTKNTRGKFSRYKFNRLKLPGISLSEEVFNKLMSKLYKYFTNPLIQP